MITYKTYQFTKYFISILLIGQLCTNVFSYVDFYLNDSDNLIEYSLIEKNSEKENEDKIVTSIFNSIKLNSKIKTNFIHKEDLLSTSLHKINLPPPEFVYTIS